MAFKPRIKFGEYKDKINIKNLNFAVNAKLLKHQIMQFSDYTLACSK